MKALTDDTADIAPYIRGMINTLLTRDRYALFALLLSGGLLCGAWFFQYGLGYAPCTMCYWQRHAHKIVLGVSALTLIYSRVQTGGGRLTAPLNILIVLALLGSAITALWHVGVEQGMLEGPKACAAGNVTVGGMSGQDLIDSFSKKIKPPACSDIVWSFLGLSMAGWNAVFSLLGAGLGVLVMTRKKA